MSQSLHIFLNRNMQYLKTKILKHTVVLFTLMQADTFAASGPDRILLLKTTEERESKGSPWQQLFQFTGCHVGDDIIPHHGSVVPADVHPPHPSIKTIHVPLDTTTNKTEEINYTARYTSFLEQHSICLQVESHNEGARC